MAAALTHRFTVAEYDRMAETGILGPDARVKLIEGEIIDLMPIGPFHSNAGSYFLNLSQRQMEVYRLPDFLGYESTRVISEGMVAPASLPDAQINLQDLLG